MPGYPGGRPGSLATPATCSGPQPASLRGPEPWPAVTTEPPGQPMQRVRSNTRLGTLIVTTVPVAALGVVVGMGLGAPLVVCGPVALVLGVGLGTLLAAGITLTPEHAQARPVHTFGVRALLARAATRRARRSATWTCASTSRRRGCARWAIRSACTAR